MAEYYYFDVDYRCACENCGKEIRGVLRRGPLEAAGGILPMGLASAADAADMALSKKLIEDALERGGVLPCSASGADRCPHCGARQSWYPLRAPKKPGGFGAYIGGMLGGLLLFLVLALIFLQRLFLDSAVFGIGVMLLGAGAGFWAVFAYRKKHLGKEMDAYMALKKEYDEAEAGFASRTVKNKPEVLWDTARRAPADKKN